MKISVVVCTLNRRKILESAVKSLVEQELNENYFEIIVVDNGSSDDTRYIIEDLANRVPNLRYVYEGNLGLSCARNRGITESSGDIVAFLDDDAIANTKWLTELLAIYQSAPDVGAAGGKIEVVWDNGKPSWVNTSFEGYFGKYDQGEIRKTINFPDYLYGSNMSLRKKIIVDSGGFREELGRKGNNLIAAEETDLFYRLNIKGIKVMYEPKAIVHHRVLAERLSKSWGLRRAFDHGRSIAMLNLLYQRSDNIHWLGQALKAFGKIFGKLIVMGAKFLRPQDEGSFPQAMGVAYWSGMFCGCLKNTFQDITKNRIFQLLKENE